MATESFFEDMVIDTPEAERNITELFESGIVWNRGKSVIIYDDPDVMRKVHKKHNVKKG